MQYLGYKYNWSTDFQWHCIDLSLSGHASEALLHKAILKSVTNKRDEKSIAYKSIQVTDLPISKVELSPLVSFLNSHSLSNQETIVSELVLKGMSNREAGLELKIDESTIKFHLTRIYRKLNVKNRSQLFVKCAAFLSSSSMQVSR